MGREQLLNQIASDSGSPSRSSTTKTTSNSDSKAAGRDRLLKQIGGYGSKTALDEDKYSEFENLYNQYESDVSGIYDSYNARAKKNRLQVWGRRTSMIRPWPRRRRREPAAVL